MITIELKRWAFTWKVSTRFGKVELCDDIVSKFIPEGRTDCVLYLNNRMKKGYTLIRFNLDNCYWNWKIKGIEIENGDYSFSIEPKTLVEIFTAVNKSFRPTHKKTRLYFKFE